MKMALWGVSLGLMMMVGGCVSVPPQAPELSAELGKRISAIEQAHITLLNRFFDEKREDVNRFIQNEWIPEFAHQFFSNSTVSKAWDTLVSENNPTDRLKFLTKTGTRLQQQIDQKRQELMQPLNSLEQRIETKIRGDYRQARAINNSITSFLMSAAEVNRNRDNYLEMAGVNDEKLDQWVDKTDDVVSDLLKDANETKDKVERSEEFVKKLKSLKESIY